MAESIPSTVGEYVIGHVPGFEEKALSKKVPPNDRVVIALFTSDEAARTFITDLGKNPTIRISR